MKYRVTSAFPFGDVTFYSQEIQVSVKDEIKNPILVDQFQYPVIKEICMPMVPGEWGLIISGHEDDRWPNPDDPVPELRVFVKNACTSKSEIYIHNKYVDVSHCKKSSDSKREACFYLHGYYR